MKKLKKIIITKILPHITFALSAMFITFLILDNFNPVMEFINNDISRVLLYVFAGTSLIESIYITVTNVKKKQ